MTTPGIYIDHYRHLERKEFPSQQDEAIRHFERLGFPSPKHEEWKYTNILPILSRDYSFELPGLNYTREEILKRIPFVKNALFLVLENGALNKDASSFGTLPSGLEIRTLSEAKALPAVAAHFNKYADVTDDSFAALNTAFANDGIFLHLGKDTLVDKPIYIIQVATAGHDAHVVHNRLLWIAEEGSSAKVSLLSISGSDLAESFSNSILEIAAGKNAILELDLFQDENEKSNQLTGTHVYQSAGSKFSVCTVSTGANILRNKLHIKLDGEGCEANMHGLYLAGGTQLMDNHTAVFHARPHSLSNELYKGILGGKSHGVFNGKIVVERDAQKTNAYQSNKNILLGNDAVINAKPQLEIFADDVKCSHGATTGQLDDEALFYLRARGINEADARAMLNLAFSNDILNAISDPDLKEYIAERVAIKLRQITA